MAVRPSVAAQVAAASSAMRRVRNVVMFVLPGCFDWRHWLALVIALTLGEVPGSLELDEAGERLYFSGKGPGLLAADCLRRRRHVGIIGAERTAGRYRAGGARGGVFGPVSGAIVGDPPEGRAPGASVAIAIGSRPRVMAWDRRRA